MGGTVQRAAWIVMAILGVGGSGLRAQGTDTTCQKEDFEVVVETTAESLRDLNNKNRPEFQEKLRELKAKRNWNQNEFMEKAAPFVRDDKTEVYDKSTDELLSAISSMGREGASAASPDCAMLLELRARMKVLVDTQTAKWNYMFEKLNAELAK
jgi:hypothetical protein